MGASPTRDQCIRPRMDKAPSRPGHRRAPDTRSDPRPRKRTESQEPCALPPRPRTVTDPRPRRHPPLASTSPTPTWPLCGSPERGSADRCAPTLGAPRSVARSPRSTRLSPVRTRRGRLLPRDGRGSSAALPSPRRAHLYRRRLISYAVSSDRSLETSDVARTERQPSPTPGPPRTGDMCASRLPQRSGDGSLCLGRGLPADWARGGYLKTRAAPGSARHRPDLSWPPQAPWPTHAENSGGRAKRSVGVGRGDRIGVFAG
jgi:hypothetical protein